MIVDFALKCLNNYRGRVHVMIALIRNFFNRYFFLVLMSLASIVTYLWLDSVLRAAPSCQMKKNVLLDYGTAVQFNYFDRFGNLDRRLRVDKIVRYSGNKKVFIEKPRLYFFSNKKMAARAFAKKGEFSSDVSLIELFDSGEFFLLPSDKMHGIRITSNYFKVLISEQIISSNQPVKVVSGLSFADADNLLYSHKTQNIDLWGNVRGCLTHIKNNNKQAKYN